MDVEIGGPEESLVNEKGERDKNLDEREQLEGTDEKLKSESVEDRSIVLDTVPVNTAVEGKKSTDMNDSTVKTVQEKRRNKI